MNRDVYVAIVVLGDGGRSPRMVNHALELMELTGDRHKVTFICYDGSQPPAKLLTYKSVKFNHMRRPPSVLPGPKIFQFALKALLQAWYLVISLPWFSARMDYVLVQTPPGIPTLPVLYFYCLLRGSRLLVDIHNYSHTILALKLGTGHKLVKITQFIEMVFCRMAHGTFCVSKAMQKDLQENWGVKSAVLYDSPLWNRRPFTIKDKHEFFLRLGQEYPEFQGDAATKTRFTVGQRVEIPEFRRESVDGVSSVVTEPETEEREYMLRNVSLLENRPGFLVSSTSWTEDEDFSILLSALQTYEARCKSDKLPHLLCVITGKGDLKEFYLKKIEELKMKHVTFLTPWLTAEDYPLMLTSADIGISLHTSSSGLDLPMKVVDMFGGGLPVAAKGFPALGELVVQGENGEVFDTSEELATIIVDWFKEFPNPSEKEKLYRKNLSDTYIRDRVYSNWGFNWMRTVYPYFRVLSFVSSLQYTMTVLLIGVLIFMALAALLPVVQ